MLRVVCMMCNLYFDGKPGDGKLSCPVWGGGKDGDNIKILPIAIFAERGADGGLHGGNLEAFQKMGRYTVWFDPKREGFAGVEGDREHLRRYIL